MIASGEKKEEYRELKEYWVKRLVEKIEQYYSENCLNRTGFNTVFKQYSAIAFKNGYSKNAPILLVECKGIKLGFAKPEWSDNFKDECFVISLGRIISTNNINQ